jgi:hypothetical protein
VLRKVFIILSGGPGLYDPADEEHDSSWDNYVLPPLLLTWAKPDQARPRLHDKDEEVHWLIYEPAYIARWDSDLRNRRTAPAQYDQAKQVEKKGFKDYLDLLKKRAQERGWVYRGLSSAQDFWDYVNGLKAQQVSRLWYYGHARDDLWLSLEHDFDHEAIAPPDEAILKVTDIKQLKPFSFVARKEGTPHKFFGCSTKAFARAWAMHLRVHARGSKNEVLYTEIHKTGGFPTLKMNAKWYQYSYHGAEKLLPLQGGDRVD